MNLLNLKNDIMKKIKMMSKDLRYDVLYEYKMPETYSLFISVKNFLFGKKIRIDASSVCQLKCPACSTASGINRKGEIGWGFLQSSSYKKLLQKNKSIKEVELSNWGEIFLNPDILDICNYSFDNNVGLTASNGVNLNNVSDEVLRGLVKYNFVYFNVSLDGACQETYERYRINGDFEKVINNIKKINQYKKELNSPFPEMGWQFIIFGHNEHELSDARKKAKTLGMRFIPKLNHTPSVSPIKNKENVKKESGLKVSSRKEYTSKKKRIYSRPCSQMWDSPQINWDGKLMGCCINKFGSFGNVFENGLNESMNSETYEYAKKMVLGLVPPRSDIPCSKCSIYTSHTPTKSRSSRLSTITSLLDQIIGKTIGLLK